ncbi:hypothetical protein RhiTH_007456 [Rhizoctonia solani]|uniref:Uncharacterized protein n=1 Tax=Rhizoctonia solani TaxID=456999 RepID=A0A8H7GZK0_9AGAM|nr:hypothetical protein RHS04_08623 [Rhizoctonia solani]
MPRGHGWGVSSFIPNEESMPIKEDSGKGKDPPLSTALRNDHDSDDEDEGEEDDKWLNLRASNHEGPSQGPGPST